ncbi:hypothetical protein DER46DRAFT_578871 [Fusarium sp. MPI-SDFR-AT-0072]|nr:hypothetical protein DER46DRAFT_578871 [Fusarium sp. MPI-SDFR-AT-0072]
MSLSIQRHSREDGHLHPFCFLQCSSLEPRRPRKSYREDNDSGEPADWPPTDTFEYYRVYLRRQILPELIDLSDDNATKSRTADVTSRYPSRYPLKDYGLPLLCPSTIEQGFSVLTPCNFEERYSLHHIMLRKFSGDHNMAHEEADEEAYERVKEYFLEWKKQASSEETMVLSPAGSDGASQPTTEPESESEDGMDIDEPESTDGDVIWSPVAEMAGQEVYN